MLASSAPLRLLCLQAVIFSPKSKDHSMHATLTSRHDVLLFSQVEFAPFHGGNLLVIKAIPEFGWCVLDVSHIMSAIGAGPAMDQHCCQVIHCCHCCTKAFHFTVSMLHKENTSVAKIWNMTETGQQGSKFQVRKLRQLILFGSTWGRGCSGDRWSSECTC